MKSLFSLHKNYFFLIITLFILVFFSFHTQNFKLDASSDTLILQNDESFKYFNYYNDIFPSKNFLVLAIKSKNIIDDDYINQIKIIKKSLEQIKGVESVFSIVDVPILLINNLKLSDLNNKNIPTLNNSELNLNIILNEFSESPIFKDQMINDSKTITSIIINLNKDNDFYEIKKIKENYINSNLKIGSIQTNPKCRISLQQRPFLTVPFLGRGPSKPVEESKLQQGAYLGDKKSCKTIMEKSLRSEALKLVPSLKATIQNPANLCEGVAADGWIRGGLPSREMSRDKDYFTRH